MFVVIAIIFFIACLATGFFLTGSTILTWTLLGLAVLSLIVHFILRSRRKDV